MANRPDAFSHADNTRPAREQHEQLVNSESELDARFMQPAVAATYSPQHAELPLSGFWRLYEAQLRSERKSANTIRIYGNAMAKFASTLLNEIRTVKDDEQRYVVVCGTEEQATIIKREFQLTVPDGR